MTTITAVSDVHYCQIPEKLQSVINESDYFFFLGDGVTKLRDLLFHKGLHAVSGNCDATDFPREEIVVVNDFRILLTHGDRYSVKSTMLKLKLRAQELNCNVVFFGHTHEATIFTEDGITFINPGALYSPILNPSYAYAVIADGKFIAKIVDLS